MNRTNLKYWNIRSMWGTKWRSWTYNMMPSIKMGKTSDRQM